MGKSVLSRCASKKVIEIFRKPTTIANILGDPESFLFIHFFRPFGRRPLTPTTSPWVSQDAPSWSQFEHLQLFSTSETIATLAIVKVLLN